MGINVVASGIFLSKLYIFVFSVLKSSLNFFKSIGTIFHLPTSNPFIFVFELFKLVLTLVSLSMSSLSTSTFKAINSF